MIDDKILDDYVEMLVKGIVGEDNKEEVSDDNTN
jgi:hypothetical protein